MFRLYRLLSCLAVAGGLAFADAAHAGVCSGPLPKPGEVIEGPVLHVEDGQTLCVAEGFEPEKWVPLRVADAAGDGTPKSALMAAAFGKDAVCKIEALADGHAVASCTIEQRPLAALLQKPGVLKAAGDWR
ncbi:hypothetical protein [Phenylobacterium sp.]|jgi:hypothetical protein|uniref:hypothetical protein n=1 Tax=Phenylobacterium sp. TaxID=1871053 RepID=UPI002E2F21EF|nr:hypothetical protein [Phenylobacterium sp.]HEX2562004.1 hypothetical protein [Phenylobacterium sp.]